MPDFMDRLQEHQAAASDALQIAARLPDVPACEERWCCRCGDQIDARRLAAVPHATKCIECAQRAEQLRQHSR